MQAEAKKQTSLGRAIEQELEFLRSNAKGQQKKGKARMRRYDELVDQARLTLRKPSAVCDSTLHLHGGLNSRQPLLSCRMDVAYGVTAPCRQLSTLGSRRWTASRSLQGLGWAKRWCR